ncbi:MAG: hypothetical protein ACLT8C_04775 [Akkermansia muciniphila]
MNGKYGIAMGEPFGRTCNMADISPFINAGGVAAAVSAKSREYPVQERVLMQPLRSECVQKEMLFPIWKYKAVNENMRKNHFQVFPIIRCL